MKGIALLLTAAALIAAGFRLDLAPAPAWPLSFPRGDAERPAIGQRMAVFLWLLIPWMLTWFGTQALGRPHNAFGTMLAFERRWPVWQWTEALYMSAYLFIPLAALLLRTQRALRRFAVTGAVATVIVTVCWLTIPVVAVNRPFDPAHALGRFLAFEQAHSVGVAAFPAFHVLWALIAASAWTLDARHGGWRWSAAAAWTWAILIALSCLSTGMHTLIDEAAAVAVFAVVDSRRLAVDGSRLAVRG
jgi:hypothetical protein